MAVDDPNSVDIISIDPQGAIILTITEHLDWNDSKAHQYSLQIKMNRYLAFIESGEILEHHPDAGSRRIVIRVVTMSEPGADGTAFLERARNVIEQAGFGFQHRTFHADQGESGVVCLKRDLSGKPTGKVARAQWIWAVHQNQPLYCWQIP